jgi:hypothetical protein
LSQEQAKFYGITLEFDDIVNSGLISELAFASPWGVEMARRSFSRTAALIVLLREFPFRASPSADIAFGSFDCGVFRCVNRPVEVNRMVPADVRPQAGARELDAGGSAYDFTGLVLALVGFDRWLLLFHGLRTRAKYEPGRELRLLAVVDRIFCAARLSLAA